jgi:long-subunit fatty acid transport protein
MTGRIAVAAAWAVIAAAPLPAQESIFGHLGFGVPEEGVSVRSRGMGNVTTALPRIHFTFRNPAALSAFDRTGISIGALLQTRTPEDELAESRQNSVEVPFLQLAFPLVGGLVLGGGYYRYLDFDGFVDTSTTFGGDTLPVRLETDGGISVLSPQLAMRFSRLLRVGAGLDFYTGSRERRRRIEFDPDVAVPTADSTEHGFRSLGVSAGVHVEPVPGLLLGGAWRSGTSLEGELDVDDDEDDGGAPRPEIEVKLPPSWSVGASYRFGPRMTVAAEAEFASWSDFAVEGVRDPEGEDTSAFGAGVEVMLPRRILLLPEDATLRAGARTRTLPRRFGGAEVRERAVSVGFGHVVGIGASALDLALEVGRRGSVSDNGIAEGFLRLGVSLAGFEQWASRGPGERRP